MCIIILQNVFIGKKYFYLAIIYLFINMKY